MEGETIKGKSAIVGEWIIRDKHGNIKDQGIDLPTPQEEKEGGQGEEV